MCPMPVGRSRSHGEPWPDTRPRPVLWATTLRSAWLIGHRSASELGATDRIRTGDILDHNQVL
jgi:hypothetical protein